MASVCIILRAFETTSLKSCHVCTFRIKKILFEIKKEKHHVLKMVEKEEKRGRERERETNKIYKGGWIKELSVLIMLRLFVVIKKIVRRFIDDATPHVTSFSSISYCNNSDYFTTQPIFQLQQHLDLEKFTEAILWTLV